MSCERQPRSAASVGCKQKAQEGLHPTSRARGSSIWRALGLLLLAVFTIEICSVSLAQSGHPVLHHREAGQPSSAASEEPAVTTGLSTLPSDVSGEYLLGDNGEVIEIDLQPKHLDGYISLRGDNSSDNGTPLTFFFKDSTLDGVEIAFTTHRIHETWYSFRGTIVRGATQDRSAQGYYKLDGTLTKHDVVGGTDHPRIVSLPMASQSVPQS